MIVPDEIDAYAEAHTTPPSELLAELAAETRETMSSAQMLTGTVEGRFLEQLVFGLQAKRVLELGTFTGWSSIAMASALPPDGTIVTCDVDPEAHEIARRYAEEAGVTDRIDYRLGPGIETMRSLDGPFDLVFIDADKTNYANYYDAVLPKLAPDGIIAADNTLWSGQVLDANDKSENTEAIRAFNEKVRDDPRVVCVQLTIRDGVTLIRKA